MTTESHENHPSGPLLGLGFSDQLGPLPVAGRTPMLDLLRSIPADARMIYEHSPTEIQSIPVGRLAADAAAEIEGLRGAIAADDERLQRAASSGGVPYFGCDTAEHMADEINALRRPWQPIETAPRDSKPVLVFDPSQRGGVFKAHMCRMMTGKEEWITHGALHKLRPTHWMPLPAWPNVRVKPDTTV